MSKERIVGGMQVRVSEEHSANDDSIRKLVGSTGLTSAQAEFDTRIFTVERIRNNGKHLEITHPDLGEKTYPVRAKYFVPVQAQ